MVRRRRAPEGLRPTALALLLAACGAAPGSAPDSEPEPILATPVGGVGLYTFALPEGSAPRPPGFEAAGARHAAAVEAFHAGDAAGAAEGFLEAARLARVEPGSFYALAVEGARTAACRNAALAFDAAGLAETARARAADLRAADPPCADALRALSPRP